jgi:hypothetical protein
MFLANVYQRIVCTSFSFTAGETSSKGGAFSGAADRESLLERFTRLSKGRGTPSPARLPLELRWRDCLGASTETREVVGLDDTAAVIEDSLEVELDVESRSMCER